MRWQRINLCDTGHGSCQGRANRSSGTNQISVLIGLPHKFLGNDIHHRITIGNNGVQLPIQTVLYDLWQRISVHFMGLRKTDILKILLRILNDRRKFIRMDGRDLLDHIRDLVGIGDNHFFRLLTSKIGKFLKHLLCCTQIKRCLVICIGKTISGHDDTSVNLILRIHKMHITGCNNRFFKLLTQFNNLPIHLF